MARGGQNAPAAHIRSPSSPLLLLGIEPFARGPFRCRSPCCIQVFSAFNFLDDLFSVFSKIRFNLGFIEPEVDEHAAINLHRHTPAFTKPMPKTSSSEKAFCARPRCHLSGDQLSHAVPGARSSVAGASSVASAFGASLVAC